MSRSLTVPCVSRFSRNGAKIRKRRTNDGEQNMFSGLLVCADCGSNLHFHFNQGNPEIKIFQLLQL